MSETTVYGASEDFVLLVKAVQVTLAKNEPSASHDALCLVLENCPEGKELKFLRLLTDQENFDLNGLRDDDGGGALHVVAANGNVRIFR